MPVKSPAVTCLLAAALFGMSTPFAKVLLAELGPFTLAGLLYLGAAAAAFPASWEARALARRADLRNGLLLGGAVIAGGGLGPVFLLVGLLNAPAASVSLWLNLETVATAGLGWLLFREHLSGRVLLAGALVLGGGLVLALPGELRLRLAGLWIAAACLCWGLDNNFTALIDRFTPAQSTFAKGLVAGGINFAIGAVLEPRAGGAFALIGALGLGALSYGLSLILYIRAAQQLGATRSQIIFSSAPYWGVLIAWGVLLEPPAAAQGICFVVMAAALWLLNSERHIHRHMHEPLVHARTHRHDDGHHAHVHEGLPPSHEHSHEHAHASVTHAHPHVPDMHHRHTH
jgi:drug/metabolite transporter (DMT)-like permease